MEDRGALKIDTISEFGQLGDSFGTYNALITTITLICILYSIRQQHDEITAAASDLEIQRIESAERNRVARLTAKLNALPMLIEIELERCRDYSDEKKQVRPLPRGDLFRATPSVQHTKAYLRMYKERREAAKFLRDFQGEKSGPIPEYVIREYGPNPRIDFTIINQASHEDIAFQSVEHLRDLLEELDKVYKEISLEQTSPANIKPPSPPSA